MHLIAPMLSPALSGASDMDLGGELAMLGLMRQLEQTPAEVQLAVYRQIAQAGPLPGPEEWSRVVDELKTALNKTSTPV